MCTSLKCRCQFLSGLTVLLVFRELLQNSDDASAKAVEIHFETEAYVKRRERAGADASNAPAVPSGSVEKLPDLKTAIVRGTPARILLSHSPVLNHV